MSLYNKDNFMICMKFIKEEFAYHYGDLEYGKKADTRSIIKGRGTGGFGTGFYLVGSYNPGSAGNYSKRKHWEVDLSKYNLFKPRSNSEAYDLHDSLLRLSNIDTYPIPTTERELEKELDDLEYYEDNQGILKFIYKYSPESKNDYELKDFIENGYWGKVEDFAKDIIEDLVNLQDSYESSLEKLSTIFNINENKLDEILKKLFLVKSEDTLGTLLMKELGYEGIDVTHLNSDAEGLRGLDNFSYGSVIYDLKPNTYKEIK